MDTFNLICYLPWFLSVITKRDNFRTRSLDDEGTLTKRHFSQLLPGYQTSTLVIIFAKWPLMNDLKRNFAYTPRTQNPPQALEYTHGFALSFPERIQLKTHIKRIKHRWWVHDKIRNRLQLGAYHNLVKELQVVEEKFYQYFRLMRAHHIMNVFYI